MRRIGGFFADFVAGAVLAFLLVTTAAAVVMGSGCGCPEQAMVAVSHDGGSVDQLPAEVLPDMLVQPTPNDLGRVCTGPTDAGFYCALHDCPFFGPTTPEPMPTPDAGGSCFTCALGHIVCY